MIYAFDGWEFDTDTQELYRPGDQTPGASLEGIAGNVLLCLLQHQGHGVCYETLYAQGWPQNAYPTADDLKSIIYKLRKAVGVSGKGKDQRFIKNNRWHRTYCFVPQVTSRELGASPDARVQLLQREPAAAQPPTEAALVVPPPPALFPSSPSRPSGYPRLAEGVRRRSWWWLFSALGLAVTLILILLGRSGVSDLTVKTALLDGRKISSADCTASAPCSGLLRGSHLSITLTARGWAAAYLKAGNFYFLQTGSLVVANEVSGVTRLWPGESSRVEETIFILQIITSSTNILVSPQDQGLPRLPEGKRSDPIYLRCHEELRESGPYACGAPYVAVQAAR